jgi:hypothetical protein
MKKTLFIYLLFPLIVSAQENKHLQLIEPDINEQMYWDIHNHFRTSDVYLMNKDYVLFENMSGRKVLHPDMATFRLLENDSSDYTTFRYANYFAFDKDAVYYRGTKILTDTTGFRILGENYVPHNIFTKGPNPSDPVILNLYPENIEVIWQTKKGIYKSREEISDAKMYEKKNTNSDVFASKDCRIYKANNKIYCDEKETTADAKTFRRVGSMYADSQYVYLYKKNEGLFIIDSMDAKTLKPIGDFVKDKNYVYYQNHKIIKSKNFEFLGIYPSKDMGEADGCPCLEQFLFKNVEGFWCVEHNWFGEYSGISINKLNLSEDEVMQILPK